MSDDIKEIVKEKYARAALRVTAVDGASCCGSASSRGECDPITSGIYAGSDTSGPARGSQGRLARLRKSDRPGGAQARRDRARPRIGRRHRRPALRRPRRADGQGLRPRHDRRDAGPRPREPAEGGRDQRGVPQGGDRADPASRGLGGRHHLQLRDQSLGRQGSRAGRGVPGAEAGRTPGGVGRRRARRGARPRSGGASSCGSAAWPARWRRASTATSSPRRASRGSASSRPGSIGWRRRGTF